MKLASFVSSGTESYGVVVDDGIVDLGTRLDFPSLRTALLGNALSEIARVTKGAKADHALDQITWLPPIPDPDKIVCIGLNYREHAAEAGVKVPDHPSVFVRLRSTLVPHGGALIRPKLSSDLDYEAELAVVVGRGGRHIPERDALTHVAGYSCFNDGSIRDYQFKHSLAVGKNFYATGGFGPWIVTADEIPDPSRLIVKCRLNGTEVQHGRTSDLIFTVPWLISYLSGITELVPGDVVITGTPHGVGFARKPPLWMRPGDTVEVDISSIGVLRNSVVAE